MSQRRSIIKSVAVSFLLTSLTFLGWRTEVVAAQLTLSWADNSTSEDGFNIERRPGSSTTFAQIATVAANATSYTDGALQNATMYCYRVQAFNTAGSSGYSNEQCGTTAAATTSFTLTVNKDGTGTGAVTGTGINCGADCSEPYTSGTSVVLTAAAASGSTFAGWTGTGCSTGTVTLNGNITCTATFNLNTFTLTVSKSGTGSGTVTGTGINCGADCSEPYTSGTSVVLTAAAASGSTFAGWSGGGCSGTGTCTVSMSAATTVTATFNASTFTLTVNKSGTGSGAVTGTGINCGVDCSEPFASGTSVVLTAAAASGSTFAGWSGGGCTGTGTCTVSMSAATTVTASFNPASGFALTVSVAVQATSGGSASGRVVSNPVGIDCGTDCTETYTSGRVVALTPLPGTGSVFAGWTGNSDCTDGSVTMNANKSCTANFALVQALLTVTAIGNGSVSSTSGGITCGSTCSFSISLGSTLALQATPTTGSAFAGWSGAGCQGTGSCSITLTTDTSVTAIFVGSGSSPTDKIGIYRPSTGQWILDRNGNGALDCGIAHCVSTFGSPDGIPVVGDWNGSGVTRLGLFLADTADWRLDQNANEAWDGCGVDVCSDRFGQPSDIPIAGKWSAKGADRIGVFRPDNGRWYLDRSGNEKWNACNWDLCARLKIYQAGDLPVTGDWDGNGTTQVGFFRPATGDWFLDSNGNRTWDGCSKDRCLSSFGTEADLPVSGDWNGTGTSKIGVFRPSTGDWFLDFNGNGQWDGCGVDLCLSNAGQTGDIPVIGQW